MSAPAPAPQDIVRGIARDYVVEAIARAVDRGTREDEILDVRAKSEVRRRPHLVDALRRILSDSIVSIVHDVDVVASSSKQPIATSAAVDNIRCRVSCYDVVEDVPRTIDGRCPCKRQVFNVRCKPVAYG